MQANLSHYEDVAELEDYILCFLPTVSDLEVFGCELELLDLREQQPLSEAFRTVLLQRPQLQIVVRPCMVERHSIWHFQADGKEGYPKAVRVPANPRGEIADRAFYAAPSIRHVEVATGIQHMGIAAWQSCQQLQIVKLPSSVVVWRKGPSWGATGEALRGDTGFASVFGPQNEGHKFTRKCHLTLDTSMAKPTPKPLLRMVEREEYSECLGASVERPV